MRWPVIRAVVAAIAVLALLSLLYWQHRTQRRVADCLDLGGRWDGPVATCHLPPGRLIMRPDLGRG